MKHFLKSDLFKKVLAAVVMVGIIIFVLIVKIPPHKNISNEKVNSLDLSTKEDSTLDSFVVDKEQVILEKKSEGSELNNKETTTVPEKINIPKETLSKNELVRASTNLIPVSVPTTTSETSVINNLPDPEIYLKMAMADLVANRLDSALTNLDKAIVVISPDSTHFKHLPADKLKFAIWLHGEVLWQLKTEQNEKGRINDEELSAAVKDVIYNFSEAIATDPQDIYRPSNERVLNRRALAYIQFGMYDAASSDFSQALQLDPEYLVTYYYRGRMKIMYTQDKQGGCDDLKKAYNDPNDRDGEIARSIVDLRQSFCTNFP